jgi:hypothetical protein
MISNNSNVERNPLKGSTPRKKHQLKKSGFTCNSIVLEHALRGEYDQSQRKRVQNQGMHLTHPSLLSIRVIRSRSNNQPQIDETSFARRIQGENWRFVLFPRIGQLNQASPNPKKNLQQVT